MKIRVSCYSGYRGEETPSSFQLGERRIEIKDIIDRWTGPDHRYFKVRGVDQSVYILRHDSVTWSWEITFFQDSNYRKSGETGGEDFSGAPYGKGGINVVH
ncbi:MAG: hypothetical protein RBT11_02035 [Desulfobacterales bacterium]|jgi:hypothetical protein|nr:hypothetical protein [Desulfobacterales bacterium]